VLGRLNRAPKLFGALCFINVPSPLKQNVHAARVRVRDVHKQFQ
jgi:hypothetical protein